MSYPVLDPEAQRLTRAGLALRSIAWSWPADPAHDAEVARLVAQGLVITGMTPYGTSLANPSAPPPPNHVIHALLSLVTFGLWLPVWGLVALGDAPGRRLRRPHLVQRTQNRW